MRAILSFPAGILIHIHQYFLCVTGVKLDLTLSILMCYAESIEATDNATIEHTQPITILILVLVTHKVRLYTTAEYRDTRYSLSTTFTVVAVETQGHKRSV